MEKKFKNLLKKTKEFEFRESIEAKTFEFDLFKNTTWFLHMNNLDSNIQLNTKKLVVSDLNTPPVQSDVRTKSIVLDVSSKKNEILNKEIKEFKTKILFVGDTFDSNSEDEDLLNKMIIAMKLDQTEFRRISMDNELENILDLEENIENPHPNFLKLLNQIEAEAPLYVISLGATMTNILLGRREKMSTIHGKFFKLNAKNWEYQLMPLFHPDFLIINPNMKRTAWNDLQEVMRLLGKI